MPARLDTRLRHVQERWARQTARRLDALPPRLALAALLDAAPEAIPPAEAFARPHVCEVPDALRPTVDRVSRWTPQEEEAHTVHLLLAHGDDPAVQRLLAALVRYEADLQVCPP